MSSFDYNAPAELFLSKPAKGSRKKYRRPWPVQVLNHYLKPERARFRTDDAYHRPPRGVVMPMRSEQSAIPHAESRERRQKIGRVLIR